MVSGLVHFLSCKIDLCRHSIADSSLLGVQQILVENQEIGILADSDGAFAIVDTELLGAVDGIAQKHFR